MVRTNGPDGLQIRMFFIGDRACPRRVAVMSGSPCVLRADDTETRQIVPVDKGPIVLLSTAVAWLM